MLRLAVYRTCGLLFTNLFHRDPNIFRFFFDKLGTAGAVGLALGLACIHRGR